MQDCKKWVSAHDRQDVRSSCHACCVHFCTSKSSLVLIPTCQYEHAYLRTCKALYCANKLTKLTPTYSWIRVFKISFSGSHVLLSSLYLHTHEKKRNIVFHFLLFAEGKVTLLKSVYMLSDVLLQLLHTTPRTYLFCEKTLNLFQII
jgi:hypothetical protein